MPKISLLPCAATIQNLEATDIFRTFMQSCEIRSSIRNLCLKGGNARLKGPAGAMLACMLTMPDENQGTGKGSSVGSSLQILDLTGNFAGFCNTLAANASRIRLPCVQVRRYNTATNADWEALKRCLPKLVYLKTLDIPGERWWDVRSREFVDACWEI